MPPLRIRFPTVLLLATLFFWTVSTSGEPAAKPPCDAFGPFRFIESKLFASPFKGGGPRNSYVLPHMPSDGPCIASTFAKSYEDGMTVFHNAAYEEVGTWRDEGGEMAMNVTDGDLDGDGQAEILIVTRWNKSGAFVLGWDTQARQLRPRWSYVRDTDDRFHRGSAIGNFTPDEGKEVVFGSSEGEILLLDKDGRLLANRVLEGWKAIQRIDIVDSDNDGYHEMIVATGRHPGMVHLVGWTSDHKLEEKWRTVLTPDGKGGVNCYEAIYHPNGHPDGGPAIAATTEQEKDGYNGSVALLDMQGQILWQDFFADEEGRAGGCGFGDLNGDGRPEIVTRSTGGCDMFVYDNRGTRIGAVQGVRTTAAGPAVARLEDDGPPLLVTVGAVYSIESAK